MTPDLSPLFDANVAISAGFVTQETIAELAPLSLEEIPEGFSRWAEKRQREFRAGRHHAKRALGTLGVPAAAIPRDGDGVPTFPPSIAGSITHTGRQRIFAAAAATHLPLRLGLDAETIGTWSHALVDRILHPAEEEALSENSARLPVHLQGKERIGVLAFSAKEAFYKCVFPLVRSWIDFHEVYFQLGDEPGSFVVEPRRPDLTALPPRLSGRYICTEEYVICGVTWPPP